MDRQHVTNALGLVAAILVGAAVSGCASGAHYIEPGGTENVVSLGKIDIQDWAKAADEMVASLLESGELEKAPHKPAIMAVSRITNGTTQQVDVDMLTKKIRVALNKSGKARTTTTIGLGGPEDPLAKGEAQRNDFTGDGDQAVKPARPDFTLSGKLLEDTAAAGSVKQKTYTFQLALTDVRSGIAVWEEEKQITKQGKQNSVGW